MRKMLLLPLLLLGGCGVAYNLKPAKNEALPQKPYGTAAAPNARQLLTPANQARPERSDELLTSSENRRGDDFDLPPPN